MEVLIPETTKVQSGNHGMTPDAYIQECMEEGDYKEACLRVLCNDTLDGDDCSCSLLFVDSSDDTGSLLHSPAPASLTALIAEKNWQAVLAVVEADPQAASKWLYGVDDNNTVPMIWKRLPIHLACTHGAPVGLLEMLIQSYPEGVATVDAHTGYLPLHMACGKSSAAVVKLLLETFPDATNVADVQGRLPLHVAVVAMASYAVVEALVEGNPSAVGVVDQNEKTAMDYALQTYGREHVVTELLSMVELFSNNDQAGGE